MWAYQKVLQLEAKAKVEIQRLQPVSMLPGAAHSHRMVRNTSKVSQWMVLSVYDLEDLQACLVNLELP